MFAKNMLSAFGNRLAIASGSEDESLPIGKWYLRKFGEQEIYHYCMGNFLPKDFSRIPLIPRRLVFSRLVKKHIERVRSVQIKNLFTDSQESFSLLRRYSWDSICVRLAGVNKANYSSRYVYLRRLASWFQKITFRNLVLMNPAVILAAADQHAIQDLMVELTSRLSKDEVEFLKKNIHSFPTRVNTNVFFPSSLVTERQSLGLHNIQPHLVVIGRLSLIKGWALLLDSLKILAEKHPAIRLTFVGDGEDRQKILAKARELKIEHSISVTGFVPPDQVRAYINSADLCLVASYTEGWSLAMTEILACGKVVVSTDVSGAKTMVLNGQNGYVVPSRDPADYVVAIEKALLLPLESNETSLRFAQKYAVNTLAEALGKLWKPLS